MVNTTRRTSTGFSSSNTESGNSKKASWRRCFGSLVVKNEQECFRWVLEGHAGYRERKLHVGKVDAMWGGLGLEKWVRPDAKQDVWRHTCVKTYMELEQKKKRPVREFQSTSFIFSFINTSRFFFQVLHWSIRIYPTMPILSRETQPSLHTHVLILWVRNSERAQWGQLISLQWLSWRCWG